MTGKHILWYLIFLLLYNYNYAQETPQGMNNPSISPDGLTIAFTYKGDIFSVPAQGGEAKAITSNPARDHNPVWSPNSTHLAFASERDSSFGIFITDIKTGKTRRLTTNNTNQHPQCFTPDGKHILITTQYICRPSRELRSQSHISHLQYVSVKGGKCLSLFQIPIQNVRCDPTGQFLVYQLTRRSIALPETDSSYRTSIWLFNIQTKTHQRVVSCHNEILTPIFSNNGSEIYFLSNESGSYNIFRFPISDPFDIKQVTSFCNYPIGDISLGKANTLCFNFRGHIYIKERGHPPRRIPVRIIS